MAVVVSAAVAWLGLFVHNLADLPGQDLLSVETLVPTLVTAVLVAHWFVRPIRRAVTWGLLVWAWLSLIGGVISVLPLDILPYEPAQTPVHYGFHALYAATQVPLIVVTSLWLRDTRRDPQPEKAPDAADE
ncbi:hypothetical protein GCM10023152_30790 [Agromyces bauzanensis]|uniref:Uncharacterized protein n=1 Tax=Agromyces bauzanensis TaxID=1308924 RepID=A0A917PP89_9MICO|nr:hypothetical protein GCM10011372_25760 [Agromyces bauzanensis]